MENYSIFDIIGPTMVGPSSSHTAGAAKVAYIARSIFGRPIKKVDFYLHGSFATTYKGHGTDKALIAGVCGLKPDNPKIAMAYEYAQEKTIEINFHKMDLGDVHPNTVKMVFTATDGYTQEIIGSSIGGGKAKIIAIDDIDVSITGQYATLITQHLDLPGFVADISQILATYKINIAFMKVFRESKGSHAVMVIETDGPVHKDALVKINALEALNKLTFFEAIQ
jgi:L-serine dehydratase